MVAYIAVDGWEAKGREFYGMKYFGRGFWKKEKISMLDNAVSLGQLVLRKFANPSLSLLTQSESHAQYFQCWQSL